MTEGPGSQKSGIRENRIPQSLLIFLRLIDNDPVIGRKNLAGQSAVAVGPLGQIAGKIHLVAPAVPGLDTDKGRVFPGG